MISNILEKLENTNSQNEKIKILETLNDTNDKMNRDVQINNTAFIFLVDKFMFNKEFDYTLYPEGWNNDGDTIYNANWKENWIEKYVRNDIADIVAAAVLGKK